MQNDYYVFGAHSRGWTMYQYLKTLEPERSILGFFYDDEEDNPEEIDSIKVYNLKNPEYVFDKNAMVYMATRGVSHNHIRSVLLSFGFDDQNIIPVTPKLDMELRNKYIRRIYEGEGREFLKLEVSDEDESVLCLDASVFVAKTLFDGDFSEPVALNEYEHIVQAGAAIADKRIDEAESYDDDGDNISDRNKQFCELTALYWVWKNAKQDIVGLEHWRRRFILPSDWVRKMKEEGIDVILPVPLCVMPSLEENYKSRHVATVWDMAMEILEKIHPEDYEAAQCFFRENNLYSPCNMIIAKREILSEYCEWLFPVLLRLGDAIGILEDSYQNRYPGFISERLMNYFFEKNRERYKIAYADKSFLN